MPLSSAALTHTETHSQIYITGVASGKAEGYLVPAINTNQKPLYLIRTAVAVYQPHSPTFLLADIDPA